MPLLKDVSSRIATLRPILIIGVVFLHVPGVSDLPSELNPGLFNWVVAFFKNGVFRGTVPTMSLIAGFLLFNSGLDRNTGKLFKKKFVTLVIPFLVFNLYCLAFMEAVNSLCGPVFSGVAQLHTAALMVPYVLGIFDYPINTPLHFVRDMIVAIMMVPILTVFLRKAPWIGLILLSVIFGLDLDGKLIFRASSLILFYIGGAAAIYRWNLLALDKYAKECMVIFIIACLIIIGLRIDDNTFLVLIAPFLIWPSAAMLKHSKVESWALKFSKYSFFIFAAHIPFIELAGWAVLKHARWVPYPVFWLVAPTVTVIFLKYVYDFLMAGAPRAFNFVIGARSTRPVYVDRRRTPRAVDAPVYSSDMRLAMTNQ